MNANLYTTKTVWDLGFREITSSVKPVRTADDLAGMKIRVPGAAAYADLFKALGAAPTSIQFNEVYPALQTKIVDGQENPLGLIETSKFYEVQKYCSLSNHIWQGNWVLINSRAWRRLPDKLQEVVETALDAAAILQRADLARLDQSFKDTIAKGGVAFNDVAADSFRAKLVAAGYYAGVRRTRWATKPSKCWKKRPARSSAERGSGVQRRAALAARADRAVGWLVEGVAAGLMVAETVLLLAGVGLALRVPQPHRLVGRAGRRDLLCG